MNLKSNVPLKHYALLLLVVFGGYWWLFIYATQYDMLDCWLPWRHFISKSFHNGIFPLWNPYQQLGYPVFADLQGPLLSSENFITGNLMNINLSGLQFILFGYLYMAAIGMYELGNYIYKNRLTSLVIASSYVLGGIFVYHTQHFFSIVSFACIPLTLVALFKFLDCPRWKYIFVLFVLFHIQFTTGNQTFNIINIHFIGYFILRKLFILNKNKGREELKKLFIKCVYLLAGTIIILLPVLVAYIQTSSEIARYEGLSYEKSLVNSMTIPSALSFINPFISSQPYSFLNTDQGMSNYFFGLSNVVCAILFFIFSKNTKKWILLTITIILFLISLGDTTPIYKLFYTIDPLLRLFRFPAYYMYYVGLILLICGGYFLNEVFSNKISFKQLKIGLLTLSTILIVVICFIGFNKGHIFYDLTHQQAFKAFKNISLNQTFTITLIISVLITVGVFILSFGNKYFVPILALFIVFESIFINNLLSLQLQTGETTAAIDKYLATVPKDFTPTIDKAISNESLIKNLPLGIWRNYHGYENVISPDFFNSFYSKKITHLDSTQELLNNLYKMPFIKSTKPLIANNVLVEPNQVKFYATCDTNTRITLKQLDSPFWQLYIDNIPIRSSLQKTDLIQFNLPNGKHDVKLIFENKLIPILFWISFVLVISSLVLFLYLHFSKIPFAVVSTLLLAIVLTSVFIFLTNGIDTKSCINKIEINP